MPNRFLFRSVLHEPAKISGRDWGGPVVATSRPSGPESGGAAPASGATQATTTATPAAAAAAEPAQQQQQQQAGVPSPEQQQQQQSVNGGSPAPQLANGTSGGSHVNSQQPQPTALEERKSPLLASTVTMQVRKWQPGAVTNLTICTLHNSAS